MFNLDHDHPVVSILLDISNGRQPSPTELDQAAKAALDGTETSDLRFAQLRRRLKEASDHIIRARKEGHNGEGRNHAREVAGELTQKLGDYTAPSVVDDDMDPRSLASKVSRGSGA